MANFTVTFRARRTQNITTVWFRDGKLLQSTADAQLVTSFTGEMEGAASVIFPAMSRSDSGVYRVVVATEFGAAVLDSTIRKQEASFQVDVEGTCVCVCACVCVRACVACVHMVQSYFVIVNFTLH